MELKDIMVQNVVAIGPGKSVKQAAKRMNLYNIGCLIVVNKGKAVGIVTERDILKKVVEPSKNSEKTKVREIMSMKPVVGAPDMGVVDAARMMLQKKIKKLPVVVNNKLVGLVTFTDIVRTMRMEPEIYNAVKDLIKSGWVPPKSMKGII
jgi:CBS domain-containing protein